MAQTSTTPRTTPTLDEIVRRLEYLPSAPRVLPRLKQLLSDGNSSTHEVVELIRLDPGISARVLQYGNSAYFSQGLRCYTVEEAVGRVGYDHIYELVSTAVASQVLVRPLTAYGMEVDALWQNSIACALAAEEVAEHTKADAKVAYTIGLLHSIGMIAIDDWALRHKPALRLVSGGMPLEFCEAERTAVGFHQAEVGAALLRLWDFPQVMSEPVRWQYLPTGTSAYFPLAGLLHVAKAIRTLILHPHAPRIPPAAPLLDRMGLTIAQLDTLTGSVAARLQLINQQLEMDEPRLTLSFPGGDRAIPDLRGTRSEG